MGFQVFYSKWVLGLSFDIRILYLIVHDDSDSEDLDGYECFAAMEQYRKNFSTLDSNSAFARHFESKVVTIKRLMNFKRAILIDLSQTNITLRVTSFLFDYVHLLLCTLIMLFVYIVLRIIYYI